MERKRTTFGQIWLNMVGFGRFLSDMVGFGQMMDLGSARMAFILGLKKLINKEELLDSD